ncbi:MAG: hypothetical protein Q8O93_01480 [bacterium]|nr:hypothetical protein [bacterium]
MQLIPKADLYDRIINRINREQELADLKKRLILQSAGFFITLPAFLFLGWKLLADLADSGIMRYLSLLSSDFNIIMANLEDYALGLLESAPALRLSLALTALLILVFNLAKLLDSYSYFRKIKRYAIG